MSPEDRIARSVRRAAEEEAADRSRRWDLARTALACVAWAALGIFLLMWSAHTTDRRMGFLTYCAGLVVGNGGIVVTLIHAWQRAQRSGDG